ncbi:MAG: hypothetical protein ACJATN_000987, partial [Neolewinella sp.]
MKNIFTLSTCILLSIFFVSPLSGQQTMVWPGDASNNGVVDEADLIFWAYAYGTKRYERPTASLNWVGQPVGATWPDTFPNGMNFAYTDMDGDGRVAGRDLQAMLSNFHRTRVPAQQTDPWVRPDTSGSHEATLRLMSAGIQLRPEGSVLLLDVVINGREGAYDKFQSLSLRATVTAGLLANYHYYSPEINDASLLSVKQLLRVTEVDSATHQLSLSITAINHVNRPINGAIARLELPLASNFDAETLDEARIVVDSLIFVDAIFLQHAVASDTLNLATDTDCSFTVSPVCGNSGVTYLNSCFAEAAG